MPIEGYSDYQRREYCKDIKCPVQLKLNGLTPGSEAYDRVRETCVTACKHTAYEFHHWLIQQGYLIVKPKT